MTAISPHGVVVCEWPGVVHLGDTKVRALDTLLARHGVDAEQVVESMSGRGPSSLGSDGTMTLDHFESYVRSAFVHGTTWEEPFETLKSVELVRGSISCDAETADYLHSLVVGEAERQSHPHNVRANAVTAWLAQRAQESAQAKEISEIAGMLDRELWAWLESVPEISSAVRALMLNPERWSARPVDDEFAQAVGLLYEIPRFYLAPPLVDTHPRGWPARARLGGLTFPRRFLIEGPSIDDKEPRGASNQARWR